MDWCEEGQERRFGISATLYMDISRPHFLLSSGEETRTFKISQRIRTGYFNVTRIRRGPSYIIMLVTGVD